jgi:hypothetical protein
MACGVGSRHEDNNGVDARLTAWGPFPGGGYLTEVDINVQLKATIGLPTGDATHFSYFLQGKQRYDDLRSETVGTHRILVVLFLPKNAEEWLSHSEDELVLRRCAYWVSLRGAPATSNSSGVTVKLPKKQLFDPQGLAALAARISGKDTPRYGVL